MKTRFSFSLASLLLLPCSALLGQTDSLSWAEEDETDFRMSLGISAGLSLVNPSQLNDQLAFVNNSLDVRMEKIRTFQQFAAFMRIKPRMASYLLMRIEALTVSRSFDYDATGRSASNNPTGTFRISSTTRWSVYPLVIGVGMTIPKTPVLAEVGLIYALGYITEEGTTEGSGSFTNTSSGDGWGIQGRIAPHFRLSKNVAFVFDVSYRSLVIKDYSDDFGRQVKDFRLELNGLTLSLGATYTFD
jgi:hypothetical protein